MLAWLLLPVICLSGFSAKASPELLFPHPEVSDREYSRLLQTEKALTSFTRYYLKSSADFKHQIAEAYSAGKLYRLKGDAEAAAPHFRKALELYPSAVRIEPATVELILDSFSQLSELSANRSEKSFWAAERYRLELLHRGAMNARWDWADVSEAPKVSIWQPGDKLGDFDLSVVNGVVFEITSDLQLPLTAGTYHVTLLSNKWRPAQLKADQASLENWQPEVKPFVQGTCHSPELEGIPTQLTAFEVIFSAECRLRYRGTALERYMPEQGFVAVNELDLPLGLESTEKAQPKRTKNYWLAATAGVLMTGLLVSSYMKDKEVIIEWP